MRYEVWGKLFFINFTKGTLIYMIFELNIVIQNLKQKSEQNSKWNRTGKAGKATRNLEKVGGILPPHSKSLLMLPVQYLLHFHRIWLHHQLILDDMSCYTCMNIYKVS